ncbi:hypothetical protein [Pseudopedobacter beijingensis]|uniref:O-Glycosyl hydrolase n=1 Tax=Pseudopedobacter beijingensis TaxID=1207056 RepID=A0ABW4IDX2_9SPHI
MKRNKLTIFSAILMLFCIQKIKVYAQRQDTGNSAIIISQNKQQIRLGIDAERLWHWHSAIKDELADLAVGDMKSDYVRTGINGAYEREKGVKNEAAYDQIIEVMTAMRKANPNIHFFASPRPIHEAYSKQEKIDLWQDRDNAPFSPFPMWIQEWKINGTKKSKDGKTMVPRLVKGDFHVDYWVQYYADYLNLMHKKGFDIEFMDVTNEQTIVKPEHTKYMYDNLPKKLNKGVKMPKLVAPSSFDIRQATNWLHSVDKSKGEDKAFTIAAGHNTKNIGVLTDFVKEAQALGKEAWNSELHSWTGTVLKDEIMNSSIFWEYMRAGFTGIDTWLFYGPLGGRDHTMINSNGKQINRSGKYEIFRQVVNNANRGNYVEITKPSEDVETAAFIKDNILSVWILNKSANALKSVKFEVPDRGKIDSKIEVIKWHSSLLASGENSVINTTSSTQFISDVNAESLYFFKLKLK